MKTEIRTLRLELKTIADVGIIGLPSVGKSTILSVLTSAKPKIAAYHFTTLTPNLGVATRYDRSFVMADIPGLIEGAAEGAGLGHDFLRHIERTRILVHVLDASGSEMRDPLDDYEKINAELSKFSDALAALPQVVACNKMDIPGAEENFDRVKAALEPDGVQVFAVSAATTEGFGPMLVFVAEGGDVERILDTTDPEDDVSMRRFQQLLIKTGIISALREMGAKDGDTIRLGEWEFDFTD